MKQKFVVACLLGTLSKGVFERRASTGIEAFSTLNAFKFELFSVLTLIETICPKFWTQPPEPQPKNAKSLLPVDVRQTKTAVLKLPIPQQVVQ